MSRKNRKSRRAIVRVDAVDVPLRDEPVGFVEALIRACNGTPTSEDRAPRGDVVLVRRANGQTEQVPLLEWHQQEFERHKAINKAIDPDNLDRQAFELARFKAIVESRISIYDEIEMFVLRPSETH